MVDPLTKIEVMLENYELETILSDCSDYTIPELLLFLHDYGRLDFSEYFYEDDPHEADD